MYLVKAADHSDVQYMSIAHIDINKLYGTLYFKVVIPFHHNQFTVSYTAEPGICSVHLLNDGVTVSGNSATVDYSLNGPADGTVCSLDRQELEPCMSYTMP